MILLIARSATAVFIEGVDASYLQQIEDYGGVYYENGAATNALQIFKDSGVNYVRLRIWNAPSSGYCGMSNTLVMAQRVKNLGMGLLLDFHYSDTWADPGHQAKPAAWTNLAFRQLQAALEDYTSNTIAQLKSQNTLPDIVQIGNEITAGFLWDDGKVGGSYDTNWVRFVALLNSAIQGVTTNLHGETVKIMLHVDAGGNNATCRWFFDHIVSNDIPFDVIGLSFYPWWQGTLNDLSSNINDLAVRYGKEIMVVETAYPWTLDAYDSMNNLVGLPSQLHTGFPATVEGQGDFLCAEKNLIRRATNSAGTGWFYWAPDDISAPGLPSAWENCALFDFQGNSLGSLHVFGDVPYDGCTTVVSSVTILNGALNLSIANLPLGTSSRLQRAAAVGSNSWSNVTSFVSQNGRTNWTETTSNGANNAFYRISSP